MAAVPKEDQQQHNNVVSSPFGEAVVARPIGAVSESVSQREIAAVQARVIMAKRFPRDPVVAMDRIIRACTRPTLAELAVYEYSKGGSNVSGPSIRLAEAIATEWGNFDAGVDILGSDENKSECVAYAWDMETNRYEAKRFTVRHWRDTKKGGYKIKDEREIYELCANMGARRKRACILAVIPGDVTEAAMEQCELTLKTKIEITPDYIKTMIEAFSKFGVTKEMIEKFMQRHIDTLTPALAARLKKIYASLKDGMSEPSDWFDVAPLGGEEEPPPGSRTEDVKRTLRDRNGGKKADKKDDFTSPELRRVSEGFEPITDEALALLELDGATDEAEAGAVLDRCKDQPFYSRVRDSMLERFPR